MIVIKKRIFKIEDNLLQLILIHRVLIQEKNQQIHSFQQYIIIKACQINKGRFTQFFWTSYGIRHVNKQEKYNTRSIFLDHL